MIVWYRIDNYGMYCYFKQVKKRTREMFIMKWKTKSNQHILNLFALLLIFLAYAQYTYAENGNLKSPSGVIENTTPAFIWEYDPDATWYLLWLENSNNERIFIQWYEAFDVCSEGTCSVTPELELLDDEYEWWIKNWNNFGSIWSDGVSFTVQGNDIQPSKIIHISPSGESTDSTPTYSWNEDPASTWYQLWVGNSNNEKIFVQWYETADICSSGKCSVTLESELLNGDYEWWIKSWNNFGSIWSDGMKFTVKEYSQYTSQYTIVDTGQVLCYDESDSITCPQIEEPFYGQDSQINGNTPSYTDNGNGTITDNITGLMWQQSPDTDGDGDIDAQDKLTYNQALTGADGLSLGGYDDWRLPTIKELYSLILFTGKDPNPEASDTSLLTPFIDTNYFDFAYGDTNAGERIIDAQYASCNQYVSNTGNDGGQTLFGVNFADGRIKGYGTSMQGSDKTFFVIYVRGNTSYGQNNFTNNGDNTITDTATNLMWAQNGSETGMNWENSLAWVQTKNSENYLGYNDWRLPNAKELQGIVDYTRSPDTTASAAIDELFNSSTIINEANRLDYPCYWSSTTHGSSGSLSGNAGVYVAFGRAMGYMNNTWIDVHGAGAQRSDPKSGDPDNYPEGRGPQGDAIRINNYVRLVRDASVAGVVFSADTTIIVEGEVINFTDLSTNSPTSWSWTFDGGTPSVSTEQNPSVEYDSSGSYGVSLTVNTQDGSESKNITDYITVTETNTVSAGYMLLAPMQSYSTYLVDTDESIAKTWTSNYRPGNAAYLLEDGALLRTGKVRNSNRFSNVGGAGGIVEKINWDSSVSWSYQLANDDECLHHDVEALPNGNILMIVWEYKSAAEAQDGGRNPDLLSDNELWPDKIIEVNPSTNAIVWEWHVWDHVIQDYSTSKKNYGIVADHPELIDLNYVDHPQGNADWNHINSINYNAQLDQIIISSHSFDEFWVIDHSTTTVQAASHSGGQYGMGGDILYRWGNPSAYGASGTHEFYGQHDAQWIPSDMPGAGNILVFNNGQGRPDGDYSTIEEILPNVDINGAYPITTGQSFDPSSQLWIYQAPVPTDFYGTNISGAQRLPNGNTLICNGPSGYIFEVTYTGSIVWTYQNTDGTPVFKVYKYPYDYSGLSQL